MKEGTGEGGRAGNGVIKERLGAGGNVDWNKVKEGINRLGMIRVNGGIGIEGKKRSEKEKNLGWSGGKKRRRKRWKWRKNERIERRKK